MLRLPRPQRQPGALEEGPAAPQHDRRRERELQPGANARAEQRGRPAPPAAMSPIARTSTSERPGRARPRTGGSCSSSSGFAGSSADGIPPTTSGSSAMPQIGHGTGVLLAHLRIHRADPDHLAARAAARAGRVLRHPARAVREVRRRVGRELRAGTSGCRRRRCGPACSTRRPSAPSGSPPCRTPGRRRRSAPARPGSRSRHRSLQKE